MGFYSGFSIDQFGHVQVQNIGDSSSPVFRDICMASNQCIVVEIEKKLIAKILLNCFVIKYFQVSSEICEIIGQK
jgi:hypothetical protein